MKRFQQRSRDSSGAASVLRRGSEPRRSSVSTSASGDTRDTQLIRERDVDGFNLLDL